ncbi:cytochrome b [Oryzibacter oryziterrae]|uniref:cytochrome b n=1 Tax=Oryzibacter oryziterrae TaxID=2766474 RepID=UPI001EFF9EFF|nr:cytochrome b/b6 domain-containing protein [Oryzibacter oryziterrae]
MDEEYEPKRPNGYSARQIGLHWAIVVLVFFQLGFGAVMEEARGKLGDGMPIDGNLAIGVRLHIFAGVLVLLLAAVRLVVRLGYGAPRVPEGVPMIHQRLSLLLHIIFYLLLFTVPISGLISWFIAPEIGWVHEAAKPLFLTFIVIHASAALYHHFIRRDEVLKRMLVPKS